MKIIEIKPGLKLEEETAEGDILKTNEGWVERRELIIKKNSGVIVTLRRGHSFYGGIDEIIYYLKNWYDPKTGTLNRIMTLTSEKGRSDSYEEKDRLLNGAGL